MTTLAIFVGSAGVVAILVGLVGGEFSFSGTVMPTVGKTARVGCFVMGGVLLALGIILLFADQVQAAVPLSPSTSAATPNAPSGTASQETTPPNTAHSEASPTPSPGGDAQGAATEAVALGVQASCEPTQMNALYSTIAYAGETCNTTINGDGIAGTTYASKTRSLQSAARSLRMNIGTSETTITNGGNPLGVHACGSYSNGVPACLYVWNTTYNGFPIITEVVPTDRSVTAQQLRNYLYNHDEAPQNFLGSR